MKIQVTNFQNQNELRAVLKKMAVDPAGIKIMQEKGLFYVFKLDNIPTNAANILKQEMLSRGGEVALPWGALIQKVKETSLLIFGTRRQYFELTKKLKMQPFKLKELAKELEEKLLNIEKPVTKIKIGKKHFDIAKKSILMGILNVTPNSFSDGGKFLEPGKAVLHVKQMLKDGADIIDIGGESTRPGAAEISAKEELKRIVPVLKAVLAETKAIISIDTTKAEVAEKCLSLGAHMINDVSGLKADKQLAKVAAKYQVPVVVMHRSGKSKVMQKKIKYDDLLGEIESSLQESIDIAVKAGIKKEKIIIDPGIGFGKATEQSLEIFKRLDELKILGLPILIGASRKSMIGNILKNDVEERLAGTLALTSLAVNKGAAIIRVHDIKENLQVLKICDAVKNVIRT